MKGQSGGVPARSDPPLQGFCAVSDIWIRMQAAYDLAQARLHENEIKVKLYQPQPAA